MGQKLTGKAEIKTSDNEVVYVGEFKLSRF